MVLYNEKLRIFFLINDTIIIADPISNPHRSSLSSVNSRKAGPLIFSVMKYFANIWLAPPYQNP